jgi:hypothetical protein
MLEDEANALSPESKALLSELQGSQTEANGLRSSLELSEQSRLDLEQSTKAEREAALKLVELEMKRASLAEQKAARWKTIGCFGLTLGGSMLIFEIVRMGIVLFRNQIEEWD